MKYTKEQVEGSRAYLLDTLQVKPGDIVYTNVVNVSRSGMSREITAYVMRENCPVNISASVATVVGWTANRMTGAVKVGGCGMDMGFHLVYTLSRFLFPDGFKVDGVGRNGDKSGWDKDGGYALSHRWM